MNTLMMTNMMNCLAANQTTNAANAIHGNACKSNSTRGDNLMVMCLSFLFANAVSICYLLLPITDGFIDAGYLLCYVACQMVIICTSWDDKHLKSRWYWVLSALITIIMIAPFFCDRDYADHSQVLCISIVVLGCLMNILVPMYKLYKSKKSTK